jgi:hypothetical protein
MELDGSLPSSQELSTCTYPEPDQSSPHHPILPLQRWSQCYLTIYVSVFLVVSFILAFVPIYLLVSSPMNHNYWCIQQVLRFVTQNCTLQES